MSRQDIQDILLELIKDIGDIDPDDIVSIVVRLNNDIMPVRGTRALSPSMSGAGRRTLTATINCMLVANTWPIEGVEDAAKN